MNRRDFMKKTGLGVLTLPLLFLVSPACNTKETKYGLVDAEKNIGPHRHVEVFRNNHKIAHCTAANDIEGWADIVDSFNQKQYSNKQRYYGNVEIRRKS